MCIYYKVGLVLVNWLYLIVLKIYNLFGIKIFSQATNFQTKNYFLKIILIFVQLFLCVNLVLMFARFKYFCANLYKLDSLKMCVFKVHRARIPKRFGWFFEKKILSSMYALNMFKFIRKKSKKCDVTSFIWTDFVFASSSIAKMLGNIC